MPLSEIIDWRRHPQEPELSFQEYATADFIEGLLEEWGIETRRLTPTSVVARSSAPRRPHRRTIGYRADIDALPIKERRGCTSRRRTPASCACGHDVHTAMLGTASSGHARPLHGRVADVQHAEEMLPGGARELVAHGAADTRRVYAFHVAHPIGHVGICRGRVSTMSASCPSPSAAAAATRRTAAGRGPRAGGKRGDADAQHDRQPQPRPEGHEHRQRRLAPRRRGQRHPRRAWLEVSIRSIDEGIGRRSAGASRPWSTASATPTAPPPPSNGRRRTRWWSTPIWPATAPGTPPPARSGRTASSTPSRGRRRTTSPTSRARCPAATCSSAGEDRRTACRTSCTIRVTTSPRGRWPPA